MTKGSYAITLIFRPRARFATIFPMFPRPTTPSVLPQSSRPWNFDFSHLPAFRLAVACGILRHREAINAIACSAVVTTFPSGVFITRMPRSLAALRSTLSIPIPARPITLRRSARAMTSAVTLVSLRTASAS